MPISKAISVKSGDGALKEGFALKPESVPCAAQMENSTLIIYLPLWTLSEVLQRGTITLRDYSMVDYSQSAIAVIKPRAKKKRK